MISKTVSWPQRVLIAGAILAAGMSLALAQAPTVDFTGAPTTGQAPLSVSFTLTSTNATSGSWSFGDGGTSTQRNPTYTYTTPGTYTVSVTVNGPGGSATQTKPGYITVTAPAPIVADFSASPLSGPAPLTVQFTWLTTGGATTGLWDFGDGGSDSMSQLINPSFTYRTPGNYTVTLTATGPSGSDTATKVDYITVLPPIPGPIVFDDVSIAAGMGGTYTTGNTHTGGAAWIDYNNDYWPDLIVTNGSGWDRYLYRNNGDGTFTDVSSLILKPDILLEDAVAVYADVDNDGDSDFVVAEDSPTILVPSGTNPKNGGPNCFYVNQGDGTFVETGATAGVLDPYGHRNITAGFADYDRDGKIDLYMGAWAMNSLPLGTLDKYDRTLKGNGNGTFTDSTATTGVDDLGRDTLTSLWFDANMDGWPDLYITNVSYIINPPVYESRDNFYRNNRNGTFTQLIDVTPLGPGVGNDADNGMGMDVGDIDGDGDWDLYITDQYNDLPIPRGNALYLGTPKGRLIDNTCDVAGVCANDSWPAKFEDFDRDGLVDLWVAHGSGAKSDYLYTNNGDGTFKDNVLSTFIGNQARGGSTADYDGDGDVDIFVWNLDGDSRLYRNDSTNTNNWISFRLFGQSSNRTAIGATIRVIGAGATQLRRVSGGDSAHSQAEQILHFGLGSTPVVDVSVTWPSGIVQNFTGLNANQLVFIDENLGILPESLSSSSAMWSSSTQNLTVTAATSRGGRTSLSASGYGALGYDSATVQHSAMFGGVLSDPGSVTVTSAGGGSWVIPVTVVP